MASSYYTREATVDLSLFVTLGTLREFSAQNARNVGYSFYVYFARRIDFKRFGNDQKQFYGLVLRVLRL